MFPLIDVIINTSAARTIVTPIVPVMLNPPANGISPNKLHPTMKKNVVSRKGINFAALCLPIIGFAMSSLTNSISGSRKLARPFGD